MAADKAFCQKVVMTLRVLCRLPLCAMQLGRAPWGLLEVGKRWLMVSGWLPFAHQYESELPSPLRLLPTTCMKGGVRSVAPVAPEREGLRQTAALPVP